MALTGRRDPVDVASVGSVVLARPEEDPLLRRAPVVPSNVRRLLEPVQLVEVRNLVEIVDRDHLGARADHGVVLDPLPTAPDVREIVDLRETYEVRLVDGLEDLHQGQP